MKNTFFFFSRSYVMCRKVYTVLGTDMMMNFCAHDINSVVDSFSKKKNCFFFCAVHLHLLFEYFSQCFCLFLLSTECHANKSKWKCDLNWHTRVFFFYSGLFFPFLLLLLLLSGKRDFFHLLALFNNCNWMHDRMTKR